MDKKTLRFLLFLVCVTLGCTPQAPASENSMEYPALDNQKIDGYQGIWFTLGQFSKYGDKYSGGFATYTAKHIPLAIYSAKAQKTFFVYGGIAEARKIPTDHPERKWGANGDYLLCMAGCFDHQTGTVSKPTVVYDKRGVFDPHDNPSLSMDPDGYLWVFVSGRGTSRPGFIFKSKMPYSVDAFEEVFQGEFTYPQPKYVEGKGFLHLFTKYAGKRLLYYSTSPDGHKWTKDVQLVAMRRPGDKEGGHYQISGQNGEKIAFFFNWHPDGDADKRTNIYYMQTTDFGKTWTTVDGKPLEIPQADIGSPALIREYFSKNENVYIKDIAFDEKGNPMALYVSGKGYTPGPDNGLKAWQIIYWNGREWENHPITTSDHNYDTGSLWATPGKWMVVGPTENAPQAWAGGGELVMWKSADKGKPWKRTQQITQNSPRNHNYVRKVVNGVNPFMYFWADGNPTEPSKSEIYFGDSNGNTWRLPYHMTTESAKPAIMPLAQTPPSSRSGFKIYYIRHADARHNAIQGDLQQFTAKGQEQLLKIPEKLKAHQFDLIACSPMWRCRNTLLPYLRETGQIAEIWPELTEFSADLVPLFFDNIQLPPATPNYLCGSAIELPENETLSFRIRDGATRSVKPAPNGGGAPQQAADYKAALEHVIALLKKRYSGTGKSVLLSGHGTSGKALLQLLLRPEDRPARIDISNTAMWMVEEQSNGSFTLRMLNDQRL